MFVVHFVTIVDVLAVLVIMGFWYIGDTAPSTTISIASIVTNVSVKLQNDHPVYLAWTAYIQE